MCGSIFCAWGSKTDSPSWHLGSQVTKHCEYTTHCVVKLHFLGLNVNRLLHVLCAVWMSLWGMLRNRTRCCKQPIDRLHAKRPTTECEYKWEYTWETYGALLSYWPCFVEVCNRKPVLWLWGSWGAELSRKLSHHGKIEWIRIPWSPGR